MNTTKQSTPPPAPLTVSLKEAARLLGLSKYTLNWWARAGRIQSVLLGNRRLIETAELTSLIEAGKKAAHRAVRN